MAFLAIQTQAQDILEIHKINGKISIDGKVDEPEWQAIPTLPLTMHWPTFEGQITEKTEIRIAYDDEYIYVGAICHDSNASGIQNTTFARDNLNQKTDQVAFVLDPYHDKENSLAFVVTPTGSRTDVAFKNDAQGTGAASFSWNSYWIANSTINKAGWQTEMRIPFSSLRFQVENNKVKMGMIAYRFIARKRELDIFPAVRPDWGFLSFAKASQAQTISFEGIKNKRPWYTSPYLLLGTGYHHGKTDLEDYGKINDNNAQIGLDVQHAFSDNLNVDLTVNTDFAQVEADNQLVNLTRFSLFFPEKRRFFLERSSTFDFKTDLNNNLFYSRRIGIQNGQLVPMFGGARLVGRMGKWDVGFMNMQSRPLNDLPSENFGVFRLRRNVFNPRSYVGAMMTSRIDANGNRNIAYGVDGIINMFKQDYLQINVAQSFDTNDSTGISNLDRSRIYLMWENRIINGFGYKFSYSNVGSDYNPGLGFERRFNFSQFGDQLSYSWFAPEKSSLRQTSIRLLGNVAFSNSTRKLETQTLGLSSQWEWDRGTSIDLTLENFVDNVPSTFNLSREIEINPAKYSNRSAQITYMSPVVNLLRTNLVAKAGTFYGGNMVSASASPEVIFSKFFQTSAFYQYTFIDFPAMGKQFNSHLFRLNLNASLNVKLSVAAFAQVNTLNNISSLNLRLRYNPVDGNDFYLVFNEVLNNNYRHSVDYIPFSDGRAIVVKYIHTFRL